MIKARYYNSLQDGRIQCLLCPHGCIIHEGERGVCQVRENRKGVLYSMNYCKVSAIHLDPLEKKPLYHFYPGREILSIGSVGCNFQCSFCQNCEISQWKGKDFEGLKEMRPADITQAALDIPGNIGIAYTYNEPIVYVELLLDTAFLAKEQGLRNVMISNGYILDKPLDDLLPLVDAFNIDLKSFNPSFYKRIAGGALRPVLKTLEKIRNSGKHLEITTLIIPGLNDDVEEFNELVQWIRMQLGQDTILHLSRYFPHHRMHSPTTPSGTLENLYRLAKEQLNFVYLGNLSTPAGQDTLCPSCRQLLVARRGYQVQIPGLDKNGNCSVCGYSVAISE